MKASCIAGSRDFNMKKRSSKWAPIPHRVGFPHDITQSTYLPSEGSLGSSFWLDMVSSCIACGLSVSLVGASQGFTVSISLPVRASWAVSATGTDFSTSSLESMTYIEPKMKQNYKYIELLKFVITGSINSSFTSSLKSETYIKTKVKQNYNAATRSLELIINGFINKVSGKQFLR